MHSDEVCGRAWARWGGLRCIMRGCGIQHDCGGCGIQHDCGAGAAIGKAEVLGGELQAQRGAGRQDLAQARRSERHARDRRSAAQR